MHECSGTSGALVRREPRHGASETFHPPHTLPGYPLDPPPPPLHPLSSLTQPSPVLPLQGASTDSREDFPDPSLILPIATRPRMVSTGSSYYKHRLFITPLLPLPLLLNEQ